MTPTSWIVGGLLATLSSLGLAAPETVARPLLQHPALSKDRLAFLFKGQVWVANRDGSDARRLLEGAERQWWPVFSPDGESLAFQAEFEGNLDVYVAPVAGGKPRRTTHIPLANKTITEWTRDGIVFFTNAYSYFGHVEQTLIAHPDGRPPTILPIPYAVEGAISADGRYVAYTHHYTTYNAYWKRYRGGMHRNIWVFDRTTGEHRQASRAKGTDCEPMWHGTSILFLSDEGKEQRLNLWSIDPKSGRRTQLTHFDKYDLRNPSYCTANGGEVVFEYGPSLYIYSLAKSTVAELTVMLPIEERTVGTRQVDAGPLMNHVALTADGNSAVVEARGDLWLLRSDADPRNLTGTSGVFERGPECSPDGKWIAYFSDATGEHQLWLMDASGWSARRQVTRFSDGHYSTAAWSPDSSRVAFKDTGGRVLVADIGSGAVVAVTQDKYGLGANLTYSWSTDSRYLLCNRRESTRLMSLCRFDVRNGSVEQLTAGVHSDYWPTVAGERVYFMGDRDYGRVQFDVNDNQYVLAGIRVVMSAPFPKARVADPDSFERSAQRLPLRSGRMTALRAINESLIAYVRANETGERPLVTFDTTTSRENVIVTNVFGTPAYDASQTRCLVNTPDGMQIVSLVGGAPMTIRSRPMPVEIDQRAEWRQIERDLWRMCRDMFYNPHHAEPDWDGLWRRYEPMMQGCMTRQDVNDVLAQFLAEVSTSHSWMTNGGDTQPSPQQVLVGTLGCDFETSGASHVIKKMYVAPWHARIKSPFEGTGVAVGDAIVAIDGQSVDTSLDIGAQLVGKASKPVEVSVRTRYGERRTVTVTPLSSEIGLRRACWIEERRLMVEKLSEGRVGYVHIGGVTTQDIASFKRQFELAATLEGMVIDVRWSNGGFLADVWSQMIGRNPLNAFVTREGGVAPAGGYAPRGPVAMVVNQITVSAGEGLAHYFRKSGTGKVFGARTWGGYVGLMGNPDLIDGGNFIVPNAPFFDDGEWIIENFGLVPDVIVADDPTGNSDPQLERAVRHVLSEIKKRPFFRLEPPPARGGLPGLAAR